jgi:multicomponent Na+:H+ antiporter subunit D
MVQNSFDLYPANITMAIGFMLTGIGIKAAIFPFHIWLPDAHSTAPSTSSAILSAVIVKVYIIVLVKVLFRVFGVDILESLNIPIILSIVAGIGMIMGSIFAMAQKDIKRMLGYSSVAQVGYIILGVSLMSMIGLQAAFYHIISHGLMKAALFLSVGAIVYHKKTRRVNDFDGIAYSMPLSMLVFSVAALGMIGIPLTSGFISKLNLSLAALDASKGILIAVIIISGFLNALYYLPIIIQAFLKESKEGLTTMHVEKLPKTMLAPIILLGLLILTIGIFPNLVMQLLESAAESLM